MNSYETWVSRLLLMLLLKLEEVVICKQNMVYNKYLIVLYPLMRGGNDQKHSVEKFFYLTTYIYIFLNFCIHSILICLEKPVVLLKSPSTFLVSLLICV